MVTSSDNIVAAAVGAPRKYRDCRFPGSGSRNPGGVDEVGRLRATGPDGAMGRPQGSGDERPTTTVANFLERAERLKISQSCRRRKTQNRPGDQNVCGLSDAAFVGGKKVGDRNPDEASKSEV